jgi:hypothetical protein
MAQALIELLVSGEKARRLFDGKKLTWEWAPADML